METATQALHRLTSYEPGREWDEPIDDPRVLQDLAHERARAAAVVLQALRRVAAARGAAARAAHTTAPAVAVLAGTAEVAPAELDLPQLSRLLHLAAGVVRTIERPLGDVALPRRRLGGRRARRSRSTSPCRRAARSRRACTGTTREDHALCRSARRLGRARRRSSSPASRGAPAGATASAATGTSTGTWARCSRSCSPPPTRPGSTPRSTPASPTGGHGARRRRRRARVARCRRGVRRRSAGARGDRRGRRRRSRRGAGRVPARDRGPAGR